ncbi:glutamate receptor ionotropic, NMDA 1-like isoform X3 [Pomacea canaliculata]|uniref:glutamate receptor ionotropic, NMDA 1-like isoform X3 n=1 Tax=Pomacea canaliculata TaxID=400727 RepID=UPI000D73BA95|nr:glutamate receptor ionotropic, NMDA 1-like isoform X3 [Pomacea canaliculata]
MVRQWFTMATEHTAVKTYADILKSMLAVVLLLLMSVSAEPKVVTIGASLSSERYQHQFKLAVEALNRRPQLQNSLQFNSTSILMDGNPIRSALDVCDKLLAEQVFTVVVSHPNSSFQAPISVSYTCGYYNIPVIGISARDSAFSDINVHKMFLRTVPPYSHQADVWVAMLEQLGWYRVIFVYSADEEGRAILSRFQTLAEPKEIKIDRTIKYMPGQTNYTEDLVQIHNLEARVILLTAATDDAEVLFSDAESCGLMAEDFAWIVSERAFNAATTPIGVLGLHLVNGTDEEKHISDAVDIVFDAFTRVSPSALDSPPPSKCSDLDNWQSGEVILAALKSTKMSGQTGQLSFTELGDRLDAMYEIMNMNTSRRQVAVGLYGGIQVSSVKPPQVVGADQEPLRMSKNITWPGGVTVKPKGLRIKRNLTVVTLGEIPFVNVEKMPADGICKRLNAKSNSFPCYNFTSGTTHCCSGYCIDMLENIAANVSFNFTIHLSSDGLYGSFERRNGSESKQWNGMMGELIDGKADLIVAPLTINPERAAYIDFTKPFKYQGLNILVRKTQKDSSLASFLQPFQDTLWILVGLSVHVVALVLYLLDRFSPFGRFKLAKSEDTEEDALNLSSAMWFSWGVLLNSGIGEGTPRSFSARVLGMVWAGFAMIIVASYTANLAAFLVLDRPEALISGIDDPRLRNPTENFRYATVKGSAVEMYFKRQVELSTMYRNMEDKNYHTAEDAIEAVRKGELHAFIWDSPRLEYEAANDCDLTTAGDLFGRSGLGIGLRKNSHWTHPVSLAVLELHESGFMEELDNRWILVDSKSQCPEGNSAPATLGLTNMAGVFMMVAGGIVAGVLLIFIEIAYKRHRGLKEKELELARNAADRWRGNIEKRKKLRETWQYLHSLRELDSPEVAIRQ